MSSCSKAVLKKKKKKGGRKTLKINGEALFKRERKKKRWYSGRSITNEIFFVLLVCLFDQERQAAH